MWKENTLDQESNSSKSNEIPTTHTFIQRVTQTYAPKYLGYFRWIKEILIAELRKIKGTVYLHHVLRFNKKNV